MKKIILILITLLFISGCSDYTELNNLAIISGISIDYDNDNNKYKVAFEVLNVKSTDEEVTTKEKTYIAKGSGKSITDAFYNTSKELAKSPYTHHLKVIIIGEEVAKDKLKDITDFLLRDNSIRNIFYLVVANGDKAVDILSSNNKNNPVVSNAIKELIDNKDYVNNIASSSTFEQFLESILDKSKDGFLTSIKLDNKLIKFGPLAIFDEFKMVDYLTEDESSIINIINGDAKENYFKVTCPDDEDNYIILATFSKTKSDIKVDNKEAKINLNLETKVMENHCKCDFKNPKIYLKLQKALESEVKKNIEKTVNHLIEKNSDSLKINYYYYQKNKKYINFKDLNYKYSVDAKINKNGLIYEVKNGN